jgi:tetratricopeptide (TPR) repeat protein
MYKTIYLMFGVLVLACCGNGMDRCCLEKDPEIRKLIADGFAAGVEGGNPEEVLKIFEEALKRDPNAISALWGRGMALLAIGKFEAAHQDASKIIQLCPDLKEGYYLRAKIFEAQGHTIRCRLALRSAEKAPKSVEDLKMEVMDGQITRNPKDAQKYYNRGVTRKHNGNYKGAVEDFDEYLRLVGKPDYHHIFLLKGNALKHLGDYEGALKCFETAMEMFPGDGTIGYLENTAELRRKLGDIESAEADLRKFQEWGRQKKLEEIEKDKRALDAWAEGIRLIDRKLELEAGKGSQSEARRAVELQNVDGKLKVWLDEYNYKAVPDDYAAYRARLKKSRRLVFEKIYKKWLELKEYDKASEAAEEFLREYPDTDPKKAASMRAEVNRSRENHYLTMAREFKKLGEFDKALTVAEEYKKTYPVGYALTWKVMREEIEKQLSSANPEDPTKPSEIPSENVSQRHD